MKKHPQICLLISNNNDKPKTKKILTQINQLQYPNLGLIVIDNNCLETEEISSFMRKIKITHNISQSDETLNYPETFNLLIAKARYFGDCGVVILDLDQVFSKKLDQFLFFVSQNPKSIIGALVEGSRGADIQHSSTNNLPSRHAVYLPKKLLSVSSPLNTSYYRYFEMVDIIAKAQKTKSKIINSNITIGHKHCQPNLQMDWYFAARNNFLFIKKTKQTLTPFLAGSLVYFFVKNLLYLTAKLQFRAMSGLWAGTLDGIRLLW